MILPWKHLDFFLRGCSSNHVWWQKISMFCKPPDFQLPPEWNPPASTMAGRRSPKVVRVFLFLNRGVHNRQVGITWWITMATMVTMVWIDRYGHGSIPINIIISCLGGMNIHKSQLFWCEQKGYKVLTHPNISWSIQKLFFAFDITGDLKIIKNLPYLVNNQPVIDPIEIPISVPETQPVN